MKKPALILLVFTSCQQTGIDIFTDLSCYDCLVYDQQGQLQSVDTSYIQNFWLQDWMDGLAEWDLVADCWKVNCNTRNPL